LEKKRILIGKRKTRLDGFGDYGNQRLQDQLTPNVLARKLRNPQITMINIRVKIRLIILNDNDAMQP